MELFNYLYFNGYLSKDHKYDYSKENCIDVDGLYGTTIFNGTGVCRHLAPILTDILREYNYSAEKIIVSLDNRKIDINFIPNNNQTKEEKERYINKYYKNNKDVYDKLILFNIFSEDLVIKKAKYSLKEKCRYFLGNHVITISEFNNKCYILDPTNKYTYMKNGKDIHDKHDDKLKQCILDSLVSYRSNIVNISNMLKLETPDREDIINDMNRVKILCEDNKDMFEKFYNDNREIYEEVVDKTKVFIRR